MGTHSAFGEGSHTRAHTPKQGPSLLRSQCGFVLPAKSLLFHRAFIYIHFPVLCGPSLSAEEKKSAKMPPQLCPQPFLIAFFNFAHKWPTFAFTDESKYTLGSLRKIAHNGLHGETGGVLGGGWYHYPRRALRAAETPNVRLSKRLICRFLRLPSSTPCAVTFSANIQISLSVISVANAFALWYDKSHKSGLFGDEGEPE